MGKLIDMKPRKCYTIVKIDDNVQGVVKKRLVELGVVGGNKIVLLTKNSLAKSGIVRLLGSMICLDYFLLSSIEVQE